MVIKVDGKKCPKDHKCPMIKTCPKGAITQEGFGLPKIDKSKCVECLVCVERCHTGAFKTK